MRELIYHIGTLKTGTTSLQLFWEKNKNILLKHGIYFPHKIIEGLNEENTENAYPLNLDINDDLFKKGIDLLDNLFNKHERILLSSEAFGGQK